MNGYASRLALCAALALAHAATAQTTFEIVPAKPSDPDWEVVYDPDQDCSLLPERGPDPYALGLPAALAAVERRALTLGGLGTTLLWAEREPDPAHVPSLKRIVEGYRCFDYDAALALNALEAAGEPSAYFVGYARDWARDDRLADWAMNALAVRGDSAVYPALRAVALAAPSSGRYARQLTNSFAGYVQGIGMWAHFWSKPVPEQLEYAGNATRQAFFGAVIRGTQGDSLSQIANHQNRFNFVIPRRALSRLARAYPTAVEETIAIYEDRFRPLIARRYGPAFTSQLMGRFAAQSPELAFGALGPPASLARTSAVITPSVCIEPTVEQQLLYRADRPRKAFAAVFSYVSEGAEPVRVPYGASNELTAPPSDDPFPVVSPEVFFPRSERTAPGRPFRIAFDPGERVTWTILGRTVTASEETPRCDASRSSTSGS